MSSLGDSLLWTWPDDGQDPLTIKELITRYRKRLPVIVSVVDGYFGCHGQEIGSDEMYWIYGIARQKRILVRDKSNRHFSIPLDYRTMFHIATDANKMSEAVMPLGDAVTALNESSSSSSAGSGPPPEILLQSDQPVTVGIGAKRTKFGRLGALGIVDTYELKYLQAHSICEDKLDSRTTVIPSFMELTFSVAIGCRYGTEQQFREWKTQINAIGNTRRRKQPNVLCNEIILLDRSSEEELDEGHYEYMRPMDVVFGLDEHHYELIGGEGGGRLISGETDVQGMTSIASLETELASLGMTATSIAVKPPPVLHRGGGGGEEPAVLPSPPRRPNALDLSGRVRNIARTQSSRCFSGGGSPGSSSPPPVPARPHRHGRWSTRSTPSTPRHSPPPISPSHRPSPPPPPATDNPPIRAPSMSTPKSGDDQPMHPSPATPSFPSEPVGEAKAEAAAPIDATPSAVNPAAPSKGHHLRRYLFAYDVPRDVDFTAVSTVDLAHCLCLLSLWPYAEVFQERSIDGALLVTLDEDILVTDLGFRMSEAKKLMRFVRDKWRPSKKRNS